MFKSLIVVGLLSMFLLFGLLLPGCDTNNLIAPSGPMSPGEKLYRARCASCHQLRAPASHDDETWAKYVAKYGKKISAEDKAIILAYLQAGN